jgi:GNAT superfamily N-acetyltransferase
VSQQQPSIILQASGDELEEIIAIDDDACALYQQAGLHIDLGPEHPFARAEWDRWARAARERNVFFATDPGGRAVGLLVMSRVDGAPYLEQLSVRTSAMRRGIGRQLLMRAIEWAPGEPLWLTTYAHLPWNRPFYERSGFEVVPEWRCPGEIVRILEEQRRWLPAPEERIAMRRPPR